MGGAEDEDLSGFITASLCWDCGRTLDHPQKTPKGAADFHQYPRNSRYPQSSSFCLEKAESQGALRFLWRFTFSVIHARDFCCRERQLKPETPAHYAAGGCL